MDELDLTQSRLASEARVGEQLLRDLRAGVSRRYQAAGLSRIAVALGWPSDAFQRLRDGGPVEERRRMPHEVRTSLHLLAGQLIHRIDRVERDLAELRAEIERTLRVDGLDDDEEEADAATAHEGAGNRLVDISGD